MIYSPVRGRIVDYLGTHQHLVVDIDLSIDERGGLRLQSGAQRFYEGAIAFNFPLFFSGVANVCGENDRKGAAGSTSTSTTATGDPSSVIPDGSTWSGSGSKAERCPPTFRLVGPRRE
jgi:hypothetical protein